MKNNKIDFLFLIFFFLINLNSFSQSTKNEKIDYKNTLKVGNQIWMDENLNVDRFQNGDIITQALSMDDWRAADKKSEPAWCYPAFSDSNAHLGKLYNYFAVNDTRNIAPQGWAIPTDYDWDSLVSFLGNEISGGKKLNSIPLLINGNNSNNMGSFFNKSPGSMNFDGCWGVGQSNSWWSSTKYFETNWVRSISKDGPISRFTPGPWGEGFSIRCIKKELSITSPIVVKENFEDINTDYQFVSIGNQIWSDKNLGVKHFKNGDTIHFVNSDEEWMAAYKSKQPAWCYMNDRPINGNNYGILYNWYAVNDARGLAPKGWHISSLKEWSTLIEELGGDSIATPKIQSEIAWYTNANNNSKLTIFPGGGRNFYGVFHFGIGGSVGYWTSTEFSNDEAYCIYIGSENKVKSWSTHKNHGYYLRFIKD